MVWVPMALFSASRFSAEPRRLSSHSGRSSAQFCSAVFSADRLSAASILKWFIALATALSMLAWSTGLRSVS